MINMHAYYEFETEKHTRRHCYKSIFEKKIEADALYDLNYDDPYVEACIEIASKFGFDVDCASCELIWDAIDGNLSEYMDLKLMKLVLEYIEEENLVCYRVGMCTNEMLTFHQEDTFFYVDSGELYCILRSSGKEETDKNKAQRVASQLANISNTVTVSAETILIKKQG